MSRTALALALIAIAACDESGPILKAAEAASPPVARQDTTPVAKAAAPEIVRALYVNRWKAQNWAAMHRLIAIADTTEINAFVIDMKDEFGLNYRTKNKDFAKNAGTATKVPNLKALLDTLHAH